MKNINEVSTLVYAIAILMVLELAQLNCIGISEASSANLPTLTMGDAEREDRVSIFVDTFLKRDSQGSQLLSQSNLTLFAQGYRPSIGVFYDPEKDGRKITDLRQYFTKKLYLDLKATRPIRKQTFQAFLDELGKSADQTVICAGEIVLKYNLQVEGSFNFQNEFAKVPEGPEKERFKRCWLNDSILGTELRMLAWIYGQFFGETYVIPERRR